MRFYILMDSFQADLKTRRTWRPRPAAKSAQSSPDCCTNALERTVAAKGLELLNRRSRGHRRKRVGLAWQHLTDFAQTGRPLGMAPETPPAAGFSVLTRDDHRNTGSMHHRG